MNALSSDAIRDALLTLKGWQFVNGGLEKDFLFQDFVRSWGFLTQLAMYSEKVNHHAEYAGVYGKVHLRLQTHSCQAVTLKDIRMAEFIESILT
jgi:4a-hydroxytetrahydrobiopterin dehydratase